MSTNSKEDENNKGQSEGCEMPNGASRVDAPAQDGRDGISKTDEFLEDGSKKTIVVHPPRKLRTPGQIKQAYESGEIDLNDFVANIQAGLVATKAIVLRGTKGSGENRETYERIEYVPDYDMRLKWQDHVTNTVEGMPVKRQEIISRKLTTKEDLMKQAAKSPAYARALLEALQEVIAESSKKGASKKPPSKPDETSGGTSSQ